MPSQQVWLPSREDRDLLEAVACLHGRTPGLQVRARLIEHARRLIGDRPDAGGDEVAA